MRTPKFYLYLPSGMDQGISNILELVKASGLNGQDVDWRLAYMELQGITEQAKSSLPIPSRLGFQGQYHAYNQL